MPALGWNIIYPVLAIDEWSPHPGGKDACRCGGKNVAREELREVYTLVVQELCVLILNSENIQPRDQSVTIAMLHLQPF